MSSAEPKHLAQSLEVLTTATTAIWHNFSRSFDSQKIRFQCFCQELLQPFLAQSCPKWLRNVLELSWKKGPLYLKICWPTTSSPRKASVWRKVSGASEMSSGQVLRFWEIFQLHPCSESSLILHQGPVKCAELQVTIFRLASWANKKNTDPRWGSWSNPSSPPHLHSPRSVFQLQETSLWPADIATSALLAVELFRKAATYETTRNAPRPPGWGYWSNPPTFATANN